MVTVKYHTLTLLCKIVTVNLQIYIVTSYFVVYDVLLLKKKVGWER